MGTTIYNVMSAYPLKLEKQYGNAQTFIKK